MDISREGTYNLKLGLFKPGCTSNFFGCYSGIAVMGATGAAKIVSAPTHPSTIIFSALHSGHVIQSQQSKDLIGIISLHNR